MLWIFWHKNLMSTKYIVPSMGILLLLEVHFLPLSCWSHIPSILGAHSHQKYLENKKWITKKKGLVGASHNSSITTYVGLTIFHKMFLDFSRIQSECQECMGIFYRMLSFPQNIAMDLNNFMPLPNCCYMASWNVLLAKLNMVIF